MSFASTEKTYSTVGYISNLIYSCIVLKKQIFEKPADFCMQFSCFISKLLWNKDDNVFFYLENLFKILGIQNTDNYTEVYVYSCLASSTPVGEIVSVYPGSWL